MSERRSYIALDWVTQEIIETLNQALLALQGFKQNPEDITKLRFCLTYLHQVSGGLVMVELHGASLLSKEIETLLSFILNQADADNKQRLDTVEDAITTLASYIKRVSETHEDRPQDLLATLNTIRQHNKQEAFSAADVFDPNIAAAHAGEKQKPRMTAADFNELIQKLHQAYKVALSNLLADKEHEKSTALLHKVCSSLYKVSKSTASESLWHTAFAIVEHLQKNPISLDGDLEKTLKLIYLQVRTLKEQGVDILAATPDAAVLKALLYYVAIVDNPTPSILALREQYQLVDALEKPEQQSRFELKLLNNFINSLVASLAQPSLQLASQQAIQLLAHVMPTVTEHNLRTVEVSQDNAEQFYVVYAARINESRTIIDTIKEQIVAYINSDFDLAGITELPELLDQQANALYFPPLHVLAPVLIAAKQYLTNLIDTQQQPEQSALETLADAISGVDYYLECVIGESQSKLDDILALAQQRVAELGFAVESTFAQADSEQSELVEVEAPVAETVVDNAVETVTTAENVEAIETSEQFFVLPEDTDPEILEIFIEEGNEVVEAIREYLPALQADFNNVDALLDIRRGFHTLKGSGRMVGAMHMGDFAWSVERMLNKVRDGLAKINDNCIAIIQDAIDTVPSILQALEQGAPYPIAALKPVIDRADAEWEGRVYVTEGQPQVEESVATELVVAEAVAIEQADDADSVFDTELIEIFISEAETHIEAFAQFLANINLGYDDVKVSTELQRALHTLKGSAHMAEVHNIALLATHIESFVKDMANFHSLVDADMLALFIRTCDALQQQLNALRQGKDRAVEGQEQLINEIQQMHVARLATQEDVAAETDGLADKYTALLSKALDSLTEGADLLARWKQDGLDAQQHLDLVHSMQTLAETAAQANYPEVAQIAAAAASFYQQASGYTAQQIPSGYFELANQAQDELDDMMDIIAAQQLVELNQPLLAQLFEPFAFLIPEPLAEQTIESVAIADVVEPIVEESDEVITLEEPIEQIVVEVESVAADEDTADDEADDIAATTVIATDVHHDAYIVQFAQQLANAEEELLEIFFEEAGELFEQLDPIVADALQQQSIEMKVVAEMKRILHTLKGGARLAELSVLGDVTHDFETMLEKAEPHKQFDSAFFANMEQYQAKIAQLIDFALSHGTLEQAMQIAAMSQAQGTQAEPLAEIDDVELVAPEAESIEQAPSQATNIVADLERLQQEYTQADQETISIFMEELLELAAELESAATDCLENHKADSLKRILHTIKGGARMAELTSLGDLSHDYETMIEHTEATQQFDGHFVSQLQQYQDAVQVMVDFLASGTAAHTTPAASIEIHIPEAQEIDQAPIAADVTQVILEPSTPAITSEQDELAGKIQLDANVDRDLLALFLDEAKEQTEGIEEAIANFLRDSADLGQLEELKRLLHTLKGGARMVGIKEIGDTSHDFETFIINSERDNSVQQDNFIDEMQGYHEQLSVLVAAITPALAALEVAQAASAAEQDKPTVISNVVPIRANIDMGEVSQAAIEATKNFIDSFNKEQQRAAREAIKIQPELLENLINLAGENIIGRSRLEEQMSELRFSLDDMDMTVDRLHAQLRRLEIETEAQITFRQEQVNVEGLESFDPLEMDRYSHMQQLSKSLIEAASDIDDLSATFTHKMRDMETLLLQQARVNTELQEGLMRFQMVPFSRMVPRLRRIVRQISQEVGKKVDFVVENAEGELDRTILEKMVAPLEHMLRNAVDHGIELPELRKKNGKDETGKIVLSLSREGGEVVLRLRDNGAGINLAAVRKKAIERGLMVEGASISDHEIMQFIMHAGFSTAQQVTQISGRGVGMDVVSSEIKQMGGSIDVNSVQGQGSTFTIRVPFTVSVNRALMVCIGNDTFAIPLTSIEGIVRVSPYELEAYYQPDAPLFDYAGQSYHLRYLGTLLNRGPAKIEDVITPLPVILIRSADYTVAVQVDRLLGSREVVVKSLGPQFGMVQGLSGATVLGDGSVVIILDMMALIRSDISRGLLSEADAMAKESYVAPVEDKVTRVMVVDDSVTVRKVTSRLLERYGLEVILAKDGLDAITQLQELEQLPDIMLLDIEMPRMDGFEVVNRVRHNSRLQHIPITMITSRTGEKHRERALSLGANRYLGKPFQESELLQVISDLTGVEILQA